MKRILIALLMVWAGLAAAQNLPTHAYYNTGTGPLAPPYAFTYSTYAAFAASPVYALPAQYAGQNVLTGDQGPYYSNGTAWVQVSAATSVPSGTSTNMGAGVVTSTGNQLQSVPALPYGTKFGVGLAATFDATAYGAVCNGSGNAATGINAAIAAAALIAGSTPTVVTLPPGICNITTSILLNANNISLHGSGKYATEIAANGSFDAINASGAGYAMISDLTIKNFNANANWAINNLGTLMDVLNVQIGGEQNGINVTGSGNFTGTNLYINTPASGIGFQYAGTGQVFRLSNSIITGPGSGTAPIACVKLTGGAAFDFIGNEFENCGYGLLVQPTNATVFSIKSTNNWYDSSTSDGVLLDGSQTGGAITRVMSEGDWFSSSSAGNGLEIKGTVKGVHITDGEFMANAVNGIKIDDNATVTGFSVSGASQLAQNATCGISVGANVTNWAITDDIIGPAADFTANGTGICVASGTGDYYTIDGNNLAGNTTAALTNGATGTHGTIGVNNGATTPPSPVPSGTSTNMAAGVVMSTGSVINSTTTLPSNIVVSGIPNYSVNPGSIALVAAGSQYAIGDTITLGCAACTTTTAAIAVVSGISTGTITSFQINQPGLFTVVPAGTVTLTQASTSGSGTGAQFSVTFGTLASTLNMQSLATGGGPGSGNLYLNQESSGISTWAANYGAENTCLGARTCANMTANSAYNTVVGHDAFGEYGCTMSNIDGVTAVGNDAMRNACGNVGDYTAVGYQAGRNPSAGNYMTAIGAFALQGSSTTYPTGTDNTAVGYQALGSTSLTTAANDTALGSFALAADTVGYANTALGNFAMQSNTNGNNQTAVGYGALQSGTACNGDTAIGFEALYSACGLNSTAVGQNALLNSSGAYNTAVGSGSLSAAGSNASNNTALGFNTGNKITGGYNNVLIGQSVASTTLATGNNDVVVGTTASCDTAAAGTTNVILLCAGSTALLTITGGGTPSTSATTIAGTLALPAITTGTNADFVCMTSGFVFVIQSSACTISSERFKTDINPFTGDALSELNQLEVRSYRMKGTNSDPNGNREQIGIIAESVAKVEPKCAIYEDDLKTPKSYRPECITALLVAAAQEHVNDTRRQFELIYALMAGLALLTLHAGHLHLKVRRLHKRLDA